MPRDERTFTDRDDADQTRACTRKKAYPSERVARLAIDTIRRTSPDAAVRPYGCRMCGLWHVGAVPTDQRERLVTFDADRIRARAGMDKPTRRFRAHSPRRRRPGRRREHDDDDDD